jgi:HSP20 family molecular chaperone IbpA
MKAEPKQDDVVHKHESETPHGTERIHARKVYVPLVDIVETDQSLLLISDMPGVDERGVDVNVEKNILTIKGTVANEVPAGYSASYEEYGIGDYERSFTLPNEIDRDGIQATIKDGVLRLTLPKAKQAVARKVAVVAG